MLSEILQPVLFILASYLVKKFLELIKVEIDDAVFNSLVAGIVAYLIGLLGLATAQHFAPTLF